MSQSAFWCDVKISHFRLTMVAVLGAALGCGSTPISPSDGGPVGAAGGHAGQAGTGGGLPDASAGGSTAGAGGNDRGGSSGSAGSSTAGAGGSPPPDGGSGGPTADAGPPLPTCTGTCMVSFASSSDWAVYDDDPATNPNAHNLGAAQPVCLNAASPANCPVGAVNYGFGSGWANVPGALWVWGPGVSPDAPADLKRFVFVHKFNLGRAPGGSMGISVDDFAEVRVNDASAGMIGSVTMISLAGQANSTVTTFDLTPLLVPGENIISIAAQNGPASYAGCPGPCTYGMNPAGVAFAGTLSYH
jgi:hypothetical protein